MNIEKKDKGNNHSRKEGNRDDQISYEIPTADKTEVNYKLCQIKSLENIVNQVDRKENCSKCSQSTTGLKKYTFKMFHEFNETNTFGHSQQLTKQR